MGTIGDCIPYRGVARNVLGSETGAGVGSRSHTFPVKESESELDRFKVQD